jgi:hypothetical protein
MDEKDLDEWYKREKERLTEEYLLKVKGGNNQTIAKIRPHFEKKMKALVFTYEKRHADLRTKEKRNKRIQEPIARLKKWFGAFLKREKD